MSDVLLVIDLQNGICKGTPEIYNFESVIKIVNQRIKEYRETNKQIVFIQHNDEDLVAGSDNWKLVSDLQLLTDDITIQKTSPNSFFRTNLKQLLDRFGASSLEICGAQVEYCVDTTIKMAHGLGYNVQVKDGSVTTLDNDFMTASETIRFYKKIWNHRFARII